MRINKYRIKEIHGFNHIDYIVQIKVFLLWHSIHRFNNEKYASELINNMVNSMINKHICYDGNNKIFYHPIPPKNIKNNKGNE